MKRLLFNLSAGIVHSQMNACLPADLFHLDLMILLVDAGDLEPEEAIPTESANLVDVSLKAGSCEVDWIDSWDPPCDASNVESQTARASGLDPAPGVGKHAVQGFLEAPIPIYLLPLKRSHPNGDRVEQTPWPCFLHGR